MIFYLPRRRNGLRLAPSIALCLALGNQAALAQSQLSLERAVAAATGRSQLVIAADAQALAARETATAAGQLPDPVLKLGLNNLPIDGPDRFSVTRDFMTMRSVGVVQELTRADKRSARVRRAEREVELAQVTRQAAIADLQRDTALAWLERSYQESMQELLKSQIAQAELQVEAAQTLYRSGKGSQAEVFAARGSAEQLRDGLAQIERRVAVTSTQLGRWIGDGARDSLAPRPTLTLPAWTEGTLAEHLAQHPQIAAATQQEAIAYSEADVARAARSSDWSVELQYSQRGPAYSNMVSINLSVPLQWDQKNRQDRELAARLASVDEARARREELQRAHEAEVRAMLQEWRSHQERLGRYDASLLPLATQRSEAALASYRAGSGPLTAVLDARRGELDVRIERLRIEMDRARIWAQLNYLLPSHDDAQGKPEALQ
ncbi:MAG: TolC family protein [Thiobacillus sp.]